jgi:hypothetical protein
MERERWLRSIRVEGREELLFELEMLLRGVERYFNLHNLAIEAGGTVLTRDFRDELLDVRDALHQAAWVARRLSDPDSDQKMVFRRYVGSQLADDRLRRALVEEELGADTPEQSLFILRRSFESLRTVIDHLVKGETCGYQLFTEIGSLALREVVLNSYFRPFRPLEFRIEYDRVKSVPLLEALHGCPPRERQLFTVALLALFRVLHYLSYITLERGKASDRRAWVVLALVRSELLTLSGYCRNELAPNLVRKRQQAAALKLSKELNQHGRKIADRLPSGRGSDLSAALEAAESYAELARRQLVLFAQALDFEPMGEDAFVELMSPSAMGQRLRQDLWVFAELCRGVGVAMAKPSVLAGDEAWEAICNFIQDFQAVSYQLLRYGDYEPFDRFVALVLELPQSPKGPELRQRLGQDCQEFGQLVEATFVAVSRRAELLDKRFDLAAAKKKLATYLPRSQAEPSGG